LEPNLGGSVLDVGSGSGYTTALLSEIVGKAGKVIGIELVKELADFGRNNVAKYGFLNGKPAEIICADGSMGFEKEAPYDRILASASAGEIPAFWKKQLKIGGRIVAPVKNTIIVIRKTGEDSFDIEEFPGFIFVPLVEGQPIN